MCAMTRAREKLVLCGYVRDLEKSVERWQSGGARYGAAAPFLPKPPGRPVLSGLDHGALISHTVAVTVSWSLLEKKVRSFTRTYESPGPLCSADHGPWRDLLPPGGGECQRLFLQGKCLNTGTVTGSMYSRCMRLWAGIYPGYIPTPAGLPFTQK